MRHQLTTGSGEPDVGSLNLASQHVAVMILLETRRVWVRMFTQVCVVVFGVTTEGLLDMCFVGSQDFVQPNRVWDFCFDLRRRTCGRTP
jgi:hypothetical protein